MKHFKDLLPHSKEIIELYNNKHPTAEIGRKYNTSHTTILKLLSKVGVKRTRSENQKKYSLNETFFHDIDTKEKAYFLGVLFADGCNQTSKHTIDIKLQKPDSYLLEMMNKALNSNRPLGFLTKKKETHQNMRRLTIKNVTLSRDLEKHGMVDRKSLILEFPNIDTNLHSHFVRGYLDGDGCILIPKGRASLASADLCVSRAFGAKLLYILETIGISSSLSKPKGQNIHHLKICGRNNALAFLDWVYTDSENLRLDRKYQRYLLVKNAPNQGGSSRHVGVYRHKKTGRFIVSITINRVATYLGSFLTEDQAAARYNQEVLSRGLKRRLNCLF